MTHPVHVYIQVEFCLRRFQIKEKIKNKIKLNYFTTLHCKKKFQQFEYKKQIR